MKRPLIAAAVLAAAAGLAWWSYSTGGLVAVLAARTGDGHAIDALRAYLDKWGSLAPLVYVCAVVLEVLIAPIPGTLLYAPAGALFGGFLGGTLSLIGNVIGAAIACGIGRALGEHALAAKLKSPDLARYRELVLARGVWVVTLLRVNPLTSSDLVSYAAGVVGVPVWRVALGTFIGMAPLCYAQSYLSEQLFQIIPGALYFVIAAGLAYVLVLVLYLRRKA